jgi:hypothetical protein
LLVVLDVGMGFVGVVQFRVDYDGSFFGKKPPRWFHVVYTHVSFCFLHLELCTLAMSRIELAKIKSLTFYKDSYTAARRTSSLPQAVCVGKPCKLFQPEVIRCVSLGGTGTDVDWKV